MKGKDNKTLSKFREKRSSNLDKFYTKSSVGSLISDFVGNSNHNKVIDLGAGEGSLAASIAMRWPDASFTTVDIDPSVEHSLVNSLSAAGVRSHNHYVGDVVKNEILPVDYGDFDLAVCNPPFGKTSWASHFIPLFKGADLSRALELKEISSDLVFMAQNLRALKNGGTLAIILPDGIITGKKLKSVRQDIVANHTLKSVIQLPNNAFKDTDAYCFLAVIEKGSGPTKFVEIQRLNQDGSVTSPHVIDVSLNVDRLDYSFHAERPDVCDDFITLRELGAEIKRGTLSTVDVRRADYPTFHTTDYLTERVNFSGEMPDSLRDKVVIAEEGDILVARVDRNFHQKVAIVSSGAAALSDCVYRVRLPKKFQQDVFSALRSPSGEKRMKGTSKGVSARLLGKADFLDMPLLKSCSGFRIKELAQEGERLPLLF